MYYIREGCAKLKKRDYLPSIEYAWLLSQEHIMKEEAYLNESLSSKSMAFLLAEQAAAADITKEVNEAADSATAEVDDLLTSLPAGKMTNTREALVRAKGEISKARLKSGSALRNLIGDPLTTAMRIFTNVQILGGSIANAFSVVSGAINDLGGTVTDAKDDRTIGEIIDTDSSGDADAPSLPSREDFEKAIADALTPPEGLFGGVGQLFKKAISAFWKPGSRDVGFGLTQEDFVKDIMTLTLMQAKEFLENSKPALEDLADTDDDSPIQSLNDTLTDAGIDSEEELTGADPVQSNDSDNFELGDAELKAISDAIPSGGKATGKILNKLAKTQLFVENVMYNKDEALFIVRSCNSVSGAFISDNAHRLRTMNRLYEEKLVKYRLMKMASVI